MFSLQLSFIAGQLNLKVADLLSFLGTASVKYKVFKIPKHTHGYRTIAQPCALLKNIQRLFLSLNKFRVHECACAYVPGKSIVQNVLPHSYNKYLLKLDFEDFFHKIVPDLFWEQCEKLDHPLIKLTAIDRHYVNQLIFWNPSKKYDGKLVLSIGAPASPVISNFCMYDFDTKVYEYCQRHTITYTRYADDLSFSSNDLQQLKFLQLYLNGLIKTVFHSKLRFNPQKSSLVSTKTHKQITGLVITPEKKISIGRNKKRYIKHLVHQFSLGLLSADEVASLKGTLSYVYHVEPQFLLSLKQKYLGMAAFDELFTIRGKDE